MDAVGEDGESRGLEVDGKHAGLSESRVMSWRTHRDRVMTTAYVTCINSAVMGLFSWLRVALLYMYHFVYTVLRTTRDPGISSFVHDSDSISALMGCE